MTVTEDKIADLVASADAAFEYMVRNDEQAVRYTIEKLTESKRNEGDDRIFVSEVKPETIPAAVEAIRNRKSPKLYFWIGFIERVGGPTKHTRQYRDKQQQIADENLGLVYKLANAMVKKYGGRWDRDEFVAEGYMGLRRAVELFEPSRGFKFSTYAMTWIRQFINRYILKNVSIVHTPEDVVTSRMKAGTLRDAISIDAPNFKSEDGDEDHIQLESKILTPERQQEENEESSKLDVFLSKIDPRERQVMALRYGLGGGPTMTLQEIGKVMGVTRQRVMQIEGRALGKLKRMGGAL